MLRGKVEVEMVLLSEGSSVKKSPEDKQASVPCVTGKCQDFMMGDSCTPHQCTVKKVCHLKREVVEF